MVRKGWGFRPLSRQIGSYPPRSHWTKKGYREFPSPLEVNRFISQVFQKPIILTLKFPSPLEVNRFISKSWQIRKHFSYTSYRPLSRYIGLYQTLRWILDTTPGKLLPSSLEVHRFIPSKVSVSMCPRLMLPSPLEVYRFISNNGN